MTAMTPLLIACLCSVAFGSPFEELKKNAVLPNMRIVGGEDTDIREIPYQVALEYFGSHFCGGSLISENHVLTAAHCVIAPPEYIQVRVGTSERGGGGTLYALDTHYVHPDYNLKNLDYDIAILRTMTKVTLGSSVRIVPIALSEPPKDSYIRVSGWGMTKENGECSQKLKSVYIPVVAREECRRIYAQNGVNVTERMMCAYMPGKDSCQGDSGGPAVVNGRIAGIVSWGVGCARPNYPGVYTNVVEPDLREFIRHYAKV